MWGVSDMSHRLLSLALAAGLLASPALAVPGDPPTAPPTLLHLQVRLADSVGTPLDGSVALEVRLYDDASAGTLLWSEAPGATASNGVVDLLLGGTVPFPANAFDGSERWLALQVGADAEMTPRVRVASVPFAFRAATADDVPGKDIDPNSISINGFPVIDATGAWIGSPTGLVGPEGPQGPIGPAGPAGADGLDGATGPAGPEGPAGPAGPEGPQGPIGPAGPAGADGLDGATGPAGPEGPAGPAGPAGPEGPQGPIGPAGPAGADGLDGATGPAGPEGPAGPAGPEGPQGPIGPAGPAGADGLDGATGPAGPEGPAGPAGPEGPQGPIGPAGPAGADGLDGATGPAGPEGPAGPAGPEGPQGPIGPAGPAGADGLDGATGPAGPEGPAGPAGPNLLDSTTTIVGVIDFPSVITSTGVLGNSPGGTGVFGEGVSPFYGVQGINRDSGGTAIYGRNEGTIGPSYGIVGETLSRQGVGVEGVANFPSTVTIGVRGEVASVDGFGVFAAGDFGGTGAKFFVHPHPTDPSREIRFVCLEGNESGTYFRGSTQLSEGVATIQVPEEFRMVTEAEDLTVQLTAVGGPALLWVESKGLDQIVVRGTGDVAVDYQVNGVRRGFADLESIQPNQAFVPMQRGVPYGSQYRPEMRQILVDNGILNPDFTPNEDTAAAMGWELSDTQRSDFVPEAQQFQEPEAQRFQENGQ